MKPIEERPTPETESARGDGRWINCVDVDFARKLERERDELLVVGDELLWALCPASMTTERQRNALKAWNKTKDAIAAERLFVFCTDESK